MYILNKNNNVNIFLDKNDILKLITGLLGTLKENNFDVHSMSAVELSQAKESHDIAKVVRFHNIGEYKNFKR